MNPRTRFVLAQLAALADADKAPQMQAYMKTDMPFFGVQTKPRRAVTAQAARDFPVTDLDSYEAALRELWDQPQRECKYAAIDLARRFKRFIVPTYEHFIRDGAWWDLVDSVATHLVGGCVADCPEVMWPTIDAWISDGDLWIRRTAIICQERNRDATDVRRLFRYCAECRHENRLLHSQGDRLGAPDRTPTPIRARYRTSSRATGTSCPDSPSERLPSTCHACWASNDGRRYRSQRNQIRSILSVASASISMIE